MCVCVCEREREGERERERERECRWRTVKTSINATADGAVTVHTGLEKKKKSRKWEICKLLWLTTPPFIDTDPNN